MSISRYEIYKDSEINWLGEIPSHWDIRKMRHIVNGGLMNGLFKKKEDFGSGVKLINVFDVYQDNFTVNTESLDRVLTTPLEQEKYKVEAGDIFFVRSSLKLEGVGCSVCALAVSEPMVFECHIVRARPKEFIRPKYLINFLNSSVARGKLVSDANIVTMATIGQDKIKNLEVLVPPLEEQDRIIAFLDRKTSEIDQAIAQKQRLIELLQEQKAILINQAVTKGLNFNAPMHDSGVRRVGKIPANWAVKKVRWICSSVRDGTHNPPPAIDGEYRLLSVRNIVDGEFVTRDDDRTMTEVAFRMLQRSYHLEIDDVVVALVGGTTGKSAVVKINCDKITVQRSIGIIRPIKNQVIPEFLNFAIQAASTQKRIWEIAAKYAAQPGIYLDDLARMQIVCPNLDEQKEIVYHLKNLEKSFSEVIALTKQEIERLIEFKNSIISSAVTGKIKI